MGRPVQLHMRSALIALIAFAAMGSGEPQEPVGKRLSAIVGVAVEEYAKGVDASGKLVSAMELEEATGFLKEAREVAMRLSTPAANAVRLALDSLAAAAGRRVPPAELRKFYGVFSQALGSEGALDLPSRAIDITRGRQLYESKCASCHGVRGGGGPAVGATLAPPAIGRMDAMRDVTPALSYRIVSVGIQGTPMRAWSDSLTSDERWDVVAYVNTLRSTDADRARGRGVLAKVCPECGSTSVAARRFEWQVTQSDAGIVAMLRAGDPATGLGTSAPLDAQDAEAVVASLRADAIVAPRGAVTATGGAFDPRGAARNVMRILDEALAAARAGRGTDAADLGFDAYIAFEPLETNARMHDPGLVSRMEREFADFRSALKAGSIPTAESHRTAIERQMPAVLELAVATSTKWGTFLESFIIILREGFEAILVLGAMVTFLVKTGNKRRVRDIWIGGLVGVAMSVVLTIMLKTVLASMPASREVIEGATMLVAVLILFSVSYWLLSKVEAARWQQFIREKVTSALSHGGRWTLAFVAFLAVFREGAETALFFQALLARSAGAALPVGGGLVAGGVALAVTFTLFYRFGVRIPLRPFFAVTSGLLYWMAFVFAGKGIKELQEGGAMSRTLLAGFPQVEFIGLYPTVETLLAQLVLVGLLLFALWRTLRPLPEVGEEKAHRTPLPVVTTPPGPIPPEVAARLAELQVTARRLQERVETLEREVEHDPTRPKA
jgi:high-affinity iron transporter